MPAPCTFTATADQDILVNKVQRRMDSVKVTGQTEGVNASGIFDNLVTAGRLLLRSVDDKILLCATTD